MENDSSFSAVFSHIELINDQGKFIEYKKGAEDNWINHNQESSFKGENNIILDLLAGNFLITTSNLCCRKSVFQDIGFFQNLKYTHDYEFFLRLCYHFKVHIIDKPLLKYRMHQDNKIKENEAETDFELGLILSNFFLNYDLKKFFPDNSIYIIMLKFLNSINTYNSERMIMTLVLFGLKYQLNSNFFKVLTEDLESSFRKVTIDRFKTQIHEWNDSQEFGRQWHILNNRLIKLADEAKKWWLTSKKTHSKWSETNQKLIDTEKRLSETNQKLIEKTQQIHLLQNSRWYRLGRILTWPIRKLLYKR